MYNGVYSPAVPLKESQPLSALYGLCNVGLSFMAVCVS